MHRLAVFHCFCIAIAFALPLGGCGPDALTAASSSATSAAAAAQQAREQKAQVEARIKQLQQADQQRVQGVSEQADSPSR